MMSVMQYMYNVCRCHVQNVKTFNALEHPDHHQVVPGVLSTLH